MNISEELQDIVAYIKAYERFVVVGHVSPDGDCIGSQIALALFLRRLGKQAHLLSTGPFNKNEVKAHEMLFSREVDENWQQHAVFIVDCSTFSRTGFEPFGIDARSIDHHANVEAGYVKGFLDAKSPSSTLLVQRVMEVFEQGISDEEAAWLFLGFATDTGFFRHLRAGSGQHLRRAATLVDQGVSPADTFALLERGYTFRDRQYLGQLMASATAYDHDRIVVVEDIGPKDKGEGNPSRDSDTLYRLLLSAENTEVVIVLRADSEQISIGLRSKQKVDVGMLAQHLGGGGHRLAAGCTVSTQSYSVQDIRHYLVENIARQL
jgi:bifunctional oligoribonuclease and PAP phosphatase NrnA